MITTLDGMAPDDAPTRPLPLRDPDPDPEHDARRSLRVGTVLALGVVLLGAAAPVAQAATVSDPGARPSALTRVDGPPALPTRGAGVGAGEAISDIWGRGAGGRR